MDKLLALRPSTMRWIPSDMDSSSSASAKTSKEKQNDAGTHRTRLLSFNNNNSKASSGPHDGAPRRSRLSMLKIMMAERTSEAMDANVHAQEQSMLFAQLPIELRKIVYEYVMGEEVVHLTLGAKRKFGHFICPGPPSTATSKVKEQSDCDCKILVGGAALATKLDPTCLRLLKVCRRMYHEALPHLYTPHTFSLLHPTHLLYLPTRLPSTHLANIRALHLRMPIRALPYFRRALDLRKGSQRLAYPEDTANWIRTWEILAEMGKGGLRDLRVVVLDKSPDGIWEQQWLGLEEKLLERVRVVVGVRRFVVVLPYRSCGVDWDMGESGCVLVRPEGA